MNPQKTLEIKGNLREHPLPELLVEIKQLRLNGSLRVSHEALKTVIYFDAGDVTFAVSNSRAFRLYELLLRENKITKEQLLKIPEFTNDLVLKKTLIERQTLAPAEAEAFFARQVTEIIDSAVRWNEGEWIFSPLIRIKGDFGCKIDIHGLLIGYARELPGAAAVNRLKSAAILFGVKNQAPAFIDLLPQEAFVLSRLENSLLNVEEITKRSGLPEIDTLKCVYSLWLGDFLNFRNWKSAFSEAKVSEIMSAKLTLVKDESQPVAAPVQEVRIPPRSEAPQSIAASDGQPTAATAPPFSVDEQLERIENANNFYEVIGVDRKADLSEIKQAYFALAKRMHPDLFHQETDAVYHRRIQDAFTMLAKVYDTLKTQSSRDVYDFKLRKELAAEPEKRKQQTTTEKENLEAQAADRFEQGFSHLMDENYEDALTCLAGAVHLAPGVARYHAYYGKALSFDPASYHKAATELQAAIKIDGDNAVYRIILAEFFIQVGLQKRAEGELNRLLAKFPDHEEARALLDSLQNK